VIGDTTNRLLQSAAGFAARQAIAFLQKHNIATTSLLHAVGLSEHEFAGTMNVEHRLSAAAQAKLLEHAAEAMDDSAFGLHLAEQSDPRDVGALFYVASGGKDVSESLTLFARYFRVVNEAIRLKLTRTPEGLAVEADLAGVATPSARQNAEFAIAIILKALRIVTGREVRPIRVAFAHPRNSNLREFERFFLCYVEFGRVSSEGASSNLLEFSNDVLAIPLITADPKLVEAFRPFCEAAAKERKTAAGTLRAAVEREAGRLLPHGKAQARTVAKVLALSTRTLSRRLADEGTTYAEVIDELRRSLALQYLKERDMSLSQVAWLLGYEGSTSFNHAFKRWTGRSPSAARKQAAFLRRASRLKPRASRVGEKSQKPGER